MSTFKKIFAVGMLMLSTSAAASASEAAYLNRATNFQWNFADVYSELRLYSGWIGGDLRATAAAIGNNFTYQADGSAIVLNAQRQLADVGATLKVSADFAGSADLTAVGICNNATIGNSASGNFGLHSDQRCNTLDPYAIGNVHLAGVGGDASIQVAAIANNLAVDVQSAQSEIYSQQVNASATYASLTATVGNVVGDVTASAVAIGNNASIKHGFGN